MKTRIPSFLHEVFGESQSPGELLAIAITGLGISTGLFLLFPEITRGMPLWRTVISYLLILDIACGCIANFTRGTSDHYAARPGQRLVFILAHVHILVIAWLLKVDLQNAFLVWIYTISGALIVNASKQSRFQLFIGGLFLTIGIFLVVIAVEGSRYFLVVALLFMVKVLFSFAVDHYGHAQAS